MKFSTRDVILVGAFAALAAASAILVRFGGEAIVPFSPIPFVALAAGLMLGSRRGALAMAVYVLIGLAGVPVFAKAPFAGPQYVLQPTFGFLLGFIGAAFVSGWVVEALGRRSIVSYVVGALGGLVVIYAAGLAYLWGALNYLVGADTLAKIGMSQPVSIGTVVKIGMAPYIILDVVKMILAAGIAREVADRVAVAVPETREGAGS